MSDPVSPSSPYSTPPSSADVTRSAEPVSDRLQDAPTVTESLGDGGSAPASAVAAGVDRAEAGLPSTGTSTRREFSGTASDEGNGEESALLRSLTNADETESIRPHQALIPAPVQAETIRPTVLPWWIVCGVVALTVPAAVMHGTSLRRWGLDRELVHHARSIQEIASTLGPWHAASEGSPLPERVARLLEVQGVLHRTYQHTQTGQRVTVMILVGPAGPLALHPPEICYETRDNHRVQSQTIDVPLGTQTAHLRLLAYASRSAATDDFLVAYAFGDRGVWNVPASPRVAYAGRPMLYKLQAVTVSAAEANVQDPQGLRDFLAHLLPVLNQRWETSAHQSAEHGASAAQESPIGSAD